MKHISKKRHQIDEFIIGDNKTIFYIREEKLEKDQIHTTQYVDWYIDNGDNKKPRYKVNEDTHTLLETLYQCEFGNK